MLENLQYDVVVLGGGPSGTMAAIAAARNGAKTLLVERHTYLGGMLTASGVGPMMTFHAGKTQVVQGIPGEMVQRLVAEGYSPGHLEDFVGYASSVTPFDAEGMKMVLEDMAQQAGVELLYHTTYIGCTIDNKKITKVQLHAKNGFFEVAGKVFIDATADADLATDCGVPSVYGRENDHLAQPMTMNLKLYGVDREALMDFVLNNQQDMLPTIPFSRLKLIPRTGMQGAYSILEKAKQRGEFTIQRDQVLLFETNNYGEFIINMSRVIQCSAINPFELTQAEIQGRKQAKEIYHFLKNHIPGFENAKIAYSGPGIGIRESRKIDGVYKLTAEDLLNNVMFEDAICMGGYPIDIHSPDGKNMTHRFLKEGSWYSVPYRCLLTKEIDNLLVSGRCISTTHEGCAAIRVSPIVMGIGQGAGTAAAIASGQNAGVRQVDSALLREKLISNGAFLQNYASELDPA